MTTSQKKKLALFGLKVKKARLEKKLSQVQLSTLIDVDVRTIQRIEKGIYNVSFLTVISLSEMLGCKLFVCSE
ncbi:MAG: helix-turn-helix transcriptional regulator [Bacteroidia bacterium]